MAVVFLRTVKRPILGAGMAENLERCHNNTGNYLFEDSVRRHLLGAEEVFDFDSIRQDTELLVLSMSNFLSPTTDLGEYADAIEKANVKRTVMIGAGAQAPDYTHEQLNLSTGTERLLRVLAERSTTIGVRGYYTAEVLERHGIKNIDVIGCPSTFWRCNDPLYISDTREIEVRTAFHYTPHGEFRNNIARLNSIGFDNNSFYIAQNELDILSAMQKPHGDVEFHFNYYNDGRDPRHLRDFFQGAAEFFSTPKSGSHFSSSRLILCLAAASTETWPESKPGFHR